MLDVPLIQSALALNIFMLQANNNCENLPDGFYFFIFFPLCNRLLGVICFVCYLFFLVDKYVVLYVLFFNKYSSSSNITGFYHHLLFPISIISGLKSSSLVILLRRVFMCCFAFLNYFPVSILHTH